MDNRPIGVFDSGIGGLSVLEKMLTLDSFDNETGEMKPDGAPEIFRSIPSAHGSEDFVRTALQRQMELRTDLRDP